MAKLTLKEFFEVEQKVGQTQDNKDYKKLHYTLSKNILYAFPTINSIIEIGPGPGAMLEYILRSSRVDAKGFDINPFAKEYFEGRNPLHADKYKIISKLNEVKDVSDLLISIETFEHIDNDEIESFLEGSAHRHCWFWFSSTPFKTTPENDEAWGHINVKADHEWVWMFEKHGWTFEGWTGEPTRWSMLFKSSIFDYGT